jgi:hypothetical protein
MWKKYNIRKRPASKNKSSVIELIKFFNRFIASLKFAFQDQENAYLVMDYLPGGDLRYQIKKIKKFTEEETSNMI